MGNELGNRLGYVDYSNCHYSHCCICFKIQGQKISNREKEYADSIASENASRLTAMQRAEKNIEELLDDLNHEFHSLRQSSIDEELFDVVSGFEALKDNFAHRDL